MSRLYTGQWRAMLVFDRDETGQATEYTFTEPPSPYEDVERWLWHVAEAGLLVEGKHLEGALMVEVSQ
jgi:hypothetical protein